MTPAANRLVREKAGALAPLVLFVMLFFAWVMIGILNTGQSTYDKIKTQNGVDAVTIAVTDEAARHLNVLSTQQVGASQLFTISIVSFTMQEILYQTRARLLAAGAELLFTCRYKGTVIGDFICAFAEVIAAIDFAMIGVQTFEISNRFRPGDALATSNRVTKAINRMNAHLVRTYPGRASELAGQLAEANGLKSLFVYPPCDGSNGSDCAMDADFPAPSLPVEKGSTGVFSASTMEMCLATAIGSDGVSRLDYRKHGFALLKGPFSGGGSQSYPHLKDHVSRASGIGSLLMRTDRSIEGWYTAAFDFTKPPRYFDRQKTDSNDFIRFVQLYWGMTCAGLPPLGLAYLLGNRIETPQNYWLKGRGASVNLLGLTIGPTPDVTDFGFLYLASMEKGPRSHPADFREADIPFYAYAQGMVFNPMSHDLYTSRWEGDLIPSFHMDQPGEIIQAIRSSPGGSDFDRVADILSEAGGSRDWQTINTH